MIRDYLNKSSYYCSFGVDISTTKGMLVSMLGITVHIWSVDKSCIRTFALDLVELTQKHTGTYINQVFKETLAKHKLSDQKILRIVSDCGRNMIAAF